jgi:hypothetical protein
MAVTTYPGTPKKPLTVSGESSQTIVDAADDSQFTNLAAAIGRSNARFYFIVIEDNHRINDVAFQYALRLWDRFYDEQQMRSRFQILAETSGGGVVYPRSLEDLPGIYEQIARDLGASYGLGYAPPEIPRNSYRRIEVRMRNASYVAKTSKPGYDAP